VFSVSSCVLPTIGYQTRHDTCAAGSKFRHLKPDVESHCRYCIQDSDPPSDEVGKGKQQFVSMARCVGAGVSSSATRPSEMTEHAVTRTTTQISGLFMVETFEIHRELEYGSSSASVCFCSVFRKLTSGSACLCMLFQTGLNYLLLVQHVHTTSGQDSREKNCGLAHTTVIPFALPLGPDSSEKLYVLQTHFNHSSRPDHDCTLGHPCSHCI